MVAGVKGDEGVGQVVMENQVKMEWWTDLCHAEVLDGVFAEDEQMQRFAW